MDPDMEVMDDRAVKWGQESWGSWSGSSNAAFLPLAVRKVCLLKTKQQKTLSVYNLGSV